MTKTTLMLAAVLLLSTAACANPSPPAADIRAPTGVEGESPARPLTKEEQRQIAADRDAQEREAASVKRLFTGNHCTVYEFKNDAGDRYIFTEGYRTVGASTSAMACSVAKG